MKLARDVLDETYAGHYLSDETTDALTQWIERATGLSRPTSAEGE